MPPWITPSVGFWLSPTGDSRIYLYRDGRLRQLTRNHTYLEAARLRHISRSDDTLELPRPNFITRALGAQDTLRIDRMTVELLDGDIFLLCTGGLSNEVSELSIEQASLPGNCTLACDALLGREQHGWTMLRMRCTAQIASLPPSRALSKGSCKQC
jgi:serine/threonine protein phosphatase PrpC